MLRERWFWIVRGGSNLEQSIESDKNFNAILQSIHNRVEATFVSCLIQISIGIKYVQTKIQQQQQ